MGTVHETREDECGFAAPRVIRIQSNSPGRFGLDQLHHVPGGLIDDGLTIVFDDLVPEDQGTEVDFVAKELGVVVVGFVDVGRSMDLGVGFAGRSHSPGCAYFLNHVWIRNPPGYDVRAAVAVCAGSDHFAFKTPGWRTANDSILLDHMPLATHDVNAHVLEVPGIHPVDRGLEKAAIKAFWDRVVERVDYIFFAAENCLIELGIIDIAGKSVIFPDDQALCLAIGRLEIVDHFVELGATNGGRTWCGVIGEDAD